MSAQRTSFLRSPVILYGCKTGKNSVSFLTIRGEIGSARDLRGKDHGYATTASPNLPEPKTGQNKPQIVERPTTKDWVKPRAMAIPREGYFRLEKGRYGPVFPQTPACYGFSVVGKVKPGREQEIRDYGKKIEEAVKADPYYQRL